MFNRVYVLFGFIVSPFVNHLLAIMQGCLQPFRKLYFCNQRFRKLNKATTMVFSDTVFQHDNKTETDFDVLISNSNKVMIVGAGQATVIPHTMGGSNCSPLFSGVKYCTKTLHAVTGDKTAVPYFPLNGETM